MLTEEDRMNMVSYFATPGPITQIVGHVELLAGLPCDVPALVRVVQGNLLHIFWTRAYGVTLSPERQAEVELRWVTRQLDRIAAMNPAPLIQLRPAPGKLVGNCRDFSVLLAALLRHRGIPARARCGFATYFLPNHFEDHWVCEYWHGGEERWVLVDAQLDATQVGVLKPDFDPLDVPRDRFISGGAAWRMCRLEGAAPDTFGIHDMHGLWFVRGNLIRDVAALNKVELLPWDAWGAIAVPDEDLSAEDLGFLDEVAVLSAGDVPEPDRLAALYRHDPRLHVPETITSFVNGTPQTVAIPGV